MTENQANMAQLVLKRATKKTTPLSLITYILPRNTKQYKHRHSQVLGIRTFSQENSKDFLYPIRIPFGHLMHFEYQSSHLSQYPSKKSHY